MKLLFPDPEVPITAMALSEDLYYCVNYEQFDGIDVYITAEAIGKVPMT
jgi:hypothetical protein